MCDRFQTGKGGDLARTPGPPPPPSDKIRFIPLLTFEVSAAQVGREGYHHTGWRGQKSKHAERTEEKKKGRGCIQYALRAGLVYSNSTQSTYTQTDKCTVCGEGPFPLLPSFSISHLSCSDTTHQLPEEQSDLCQLFPAPDRPGEVIAASVEALRGAVDAGNLGLA